MKSIKWAADLDGVHEVSLWGTADFAHWQNYLASERLVPEEFDGKARIMIVAAEGKFMGLPFREISFSVLVESPDQRFKQAAFLLQAYNSRRFFAFCERVMFSTPYLHGDVTVSCESQPMAKLVVSDEVLFHAEVANSEQVSHREHAGTAIHPAVAASAWQGPVFLPGPQQKEKRRESQKDVFVARICGDTLTVPFSPEHDVLTFGANRSVPAIQLLLTSGFIPEHWEIRRSATHAKSKTMTRIQLASTSVPPLPIRKPIESG